MIKILILGGSGILSLDVLKECLKRDYHVTCVTRGTRDHRFPKGVNIIHGNISQLETVANKLDNDYDVILDFLSFDVKGLKYKLDFLAYRCKQYFFVSSSVAYSFEDEVITENTRLGNAYWDYGSNKVKCEEFLRKNYKRYGIIYTIIRPYITYGKTRIPFGIIPVSGEYWTLANRIINNKPILMWDAGNAKCTLTSTEDFARGLVDLICNPKAYNEAYHITSNEVLTWAEVLDYLGKELNAKPDIFSMPTDQIIKILPEYTGVLLGDKAKDRIFDNSKITEAAPSFRNLKPFSVGISETIKNYQENAIERTINYEWDGRIDWAIVKLAKENGENIDKSRLVFRPAEKKVRMIDKYAYYRGRYAILGKLHTVIIKGVKLPIKALKLAKKIYLKICKLIKKNNQPYDQAEALREGFHFIGTNCKFDNCDFGMDLKLISIGNNVRMCEGVKFINYRPTAEHFDKVLGNGANPMLRDLGSIVIEDNVFVGSKVMILPNVVIGKNSLILDGSVISESIPENSVVWGNPGRVVDNIFSWYQHLISINEAYPWYNKKLNHDEIVQERENYFFED